MSRTGLATGENRLNTWSVCAPKTPGTHIHDCCSGLTPLPVPHCNLNLDITDHHSDRGRGRDKPRIPRPLQRAPKGLASLFFQIASGHAMIAPFLKEKFGWVESDSCW